MAAQLPFPSTSIDKGFIDEPIAGFKPTFANYHGILELFRHITQQDLPHTSAVDAFCDQLSLHVEGVPLRSSSHGSEHAKRRNIWKKVQRKFDNYMQVLKKLRVVREGGHAAEVYSNAVFIGEIGERARTMAGFGRVLNYLW